MPTSQPDGNMVDKLAHFHLFNEIEQAEHKKPWTAGHYARTLFKKHDLRIVLMVMQQGSHMKEHHADGTISIHVLKGSVRVNVADKPHDLREGNLFTLAGSIRHEIVALADSAFLLTISWPKTEELAAMKHRGYGS